MSFNRIHVAVDFGTTFTGVAHSNPADKSSDAEPLLFQQWGERGEENDKIPTKLRYEELSRDRSGRRTVGFKWGLQVKQGQSSHEWFKLQLEPTYLSDTSIDMSQTYPNRDRNEDMPSVPAKKLTTDFLTALRDHVERNLKKKYRNEDETEPTITWIITVPAVWKSEARNITRECARSAGMGQNVQMTCEPEAAFIYAARNLPRSHRKVGNNIIVLDAGGGTVDLVTYRIRQVHPMLKVQEEFVPNGGKCGSVFINRVFEAFIDDRLCKASPPVELSKRSRLHMMNHFETFVKTKFDGEDTEEFLPVSGIIENGPLDIHEGYIRISKQDMEAVLNKVVDNVLQLVRDQVDLIRGSNDGVSAIILVGGFGGSPYLKQRLENDRPLSGIDLYRSVHPNTAVARGAVLISLQESVPHKKTVLSRKSVCSLGIASSVPFRSGHHPETHKYEDSIHKEYLCKDVLSYFVKRNDDLEEDVPKSFHMERLVPIDGPFHFTDVVYETYELEPPEILNDTCRALGSLDSDLSDVPSYLFERPGNGDHFKIRYTVRANFSAADVKVQLDFNGTSHGTASLKYGNSALYRPVRRS